MRTSASGEPGPSAFTAASQNLWIERHWIKSASDCSGPKADEGVTGAADIATRQITHNLIYVKCGTWQK